jgi:hypothetical protein
MIMKKCVTVYRIFGYILVFMFWPSFGGYSKSFKYFHSPDFTSRSVLAILPFFYLLLLQSQAVISVLSTKLAMAPFDLYASWRFYISV